MNEAAVAAGGTWSTFQQLGGKVVAVIITIAYAAILTYIILFIVNKLVGFRSSKAYEMEGLDSAYHGEHGYGMLNPN